jgi:hypothetical protein
MDTPCNGIRQIKAILDNPTWSISEKRASLGDSSEISDYLMVIAELHPDKYGGVINEILNGLADRRDGDNLAEHQARDRKFAEDVKLRDSKCRITGRFAARCEVAHIYGFAECAKSGLWSAQYDLNNGLLLDAGLHQLWDRGVIILEPVGVDRAQFRVCQDDMDIDLVRDIPELVNPVILYGLNTRMMGYIRMRAA